MSHLVLELRQGEMMVVNGATIRFRNKCRIELVSQARFLFGKQIMAPQEAATALRRLYLHLQNAYVGPSEDQQKAVLEAKSLLSQMCESATDDLKQTLLDIEESTGNGDFYKALKLLRRMMTAEKSFNEADVTAP